MPKRAQVSLRRVTIKGVKFWQVSIPKIGGGRRQRTFRSKAHAEVFFEAAKAEYEQRLSEELAKEGRQEVLTKALRRRGDTKVLRMPAWELNRRRIDDLEQEINARIQALPTPPPEDLLTIKLTRELLAEISARAEATSRSVQTVVQEMFLERLVAYQRKLKRGTS